ncbi:MAG TPA: hypothetical protein VK348_07140 [Planctomycetota bacterium]|nr:hypothetical protein [Planctomycetota bacterium]
MPSAEEVNASNFEVERVLVEKETFSMVWGVFDDRTEKKRCVGVRWNGQDGSLGFPSDSVRALWFVMPKTLSLALLPRIIKVRHAQEKAIEHALRDLRTLPEPGVIDWE